MESGFRCSVGASHGRSKYDARYICIVCILAGVIIHTLQHPLNARPCMVPGTLQLSCCVRHSGTGASGISGVRFECFVSSWVGMGQETCCSM
jgi:hypothetical protein